MPKSPFQIEHQRSNMARAGELLKLKRTYSLKYPEIKDTNTSIFWNERLNKNHSIKMEDGMTQDRIKTTLEFLPSTVQKILDIGVGYGFIEEVLLRRKKNVELYGNDISTVAIKNIKKRFPGTYKVESLYNMHYPRRFFDAIFMLEVLEHIPPSKTFFVLKKIKNILKEGGYFILSVPMNEGLDSMNDNPNGHLRMYTRQLILAELKIAGFEIIKYKEIYAFPSSYWFKSQIAKIWKRWEPNNIILLAKSI